MTDEPEKTHIHELGEKRDQVAQREKGPDEKDWLRE